MGKNPGVGDVQEVETHDHVLLRQFCFVEQPLDLVSVTKIWARQLLVADEVPADLGLVKSAVHDLAIGTLTVTGAALRRKDGALSSPLRTRLT